ncbi:MAG: tetratricopeptide repeat protein [Micropepsaceae bacterium]
MTDFFSEVEEEVRKERWQHLWQSYGTLIIIVAGSVVVSVAGWQAWERYSQSQREAASLEFNTTLGVAETGNIPLAESNFITFSADAPAGYAKLAEFQLAKAQLVQGKRDAAIESLRQLVEDPNPLFSSPARLQLAWLLSESAPRAEVEAIIAPLQDSQNPWRLAAAEISAYLDLQAGNREEAAAAYQALAIDPGVSEGTTQRAGAIALFLRANAAQATITPEAGESEIPGGAAELPELTAEQNDQEAP